MLAALCLPAPLAAQYAIQATSTRSSNVAIQTLCEHISPYGWLYFKPQLALKPAAFFEQYATQMGLGPHDEMRPTATWTDSRGQWHLRLQQYHRGMLVEGGEYTLHGSPQQLRLAHGKLVEQLDVDPRGFLSEQAALRQVLADGGRYAWQDSAWEAELKADTGDPAATYYPRGELRLAFLRGPYMVADSYRPVWYFELRRLYPDDLLAVWVDARSGEVLRERSLRRHCEPRTATAHTLYHGVRSFETRRRGLPHHDYVLADCEETAGQIETRYHRRNSFGETRSWGQIAPIVHVGSSWGTHDRRATSAHWAAQQARSYFHNSFARDGFDDDGRRLRILADWVDPNGFPHPDAMFERGRQADYLYLGAIDNLSLATPDIVGHEYTHSIVAHTARLAYERESGALEESFADIFGVLVEHHAEAGGDPDWTLGEDVGGLRSLADPASMGQPVTYLTDPRWVDASAANCNPTPLSGPTGNDYCGVHQNSGVQNRWFYLLVQGGIQNGIVTAGIGLEKAARIVYRSLTVYMQQHSNYHDARLAAIQAAVDIWGECSNEAAQVKNAWAAVGVGAANDKLCVEIWGPDVLCLDWTGHSYEFRARSIDGARFDWVLPDTWEYQVSGAHDEVLVLSAFAQPLNEAFVLRVSASLPGMEATSEQVLLIEHCDAKDTLYPRSDTLAYPAHPQLVPNPAHGEVAVWLPQTAYPARVRVFDLQGKALHETVLFDPRQRVPLQNWRPGYYFIEITQQTGKVVLPLKVY
ncbi:MAG: hypothetical protein OHK0039_32140 [Bacteroidia bacterium]